MNPHAEAFLLVMITISHGAQRDVEKNLIWRLEYGMMKRNAMMVF